MIKTRPRSGALCWVVPLLRRRLHAPIATVCRLVSARPASERGRTYCRCYVYPRARRRPGWRRRQVGAAQLAVRTYISAAGSRRASRQVRRLVSAAAAFYYCVCERERESDRQWQWVCRVQLGYAIVDRESMTSS